MYYGSTYREVFRHVYVQNNQCETYDGSLFKKRGPKTGGAVVLCSFRGSSQSRGKFDDLPVLGAASSL